MGIRVIICCHSKAYKPITATAPAIQSKWGKDSISCCEAIFVQMDVQA